MPLLLDACANHNYQAQYVYPICAEFLSQSDVGNAAIRYAGDVLLYAKLFSRPGNLMRQKEWLFHAGNSREFEYMTNSQGQSRLCSLQCLNLTLLITTENQRPFRRVEI